MGENVVEPEDINASARWSCSSVHSQARTPRRILALGVITAADVGGRSSDVDERVQDELGQGFERYVERGLDRDCKL